MQRLSEKLPTAKMPRECEQILKQAGGAGLFGRSKSKVPKTWNIAEGHGGRSYTYPTNGVDIPLNGKSVDDEFMTGKTVEQRAKIRKLRTRMSMRGALNVPGVNAAEVEKARQEEMQRRKSRRAEEWK